MRRFLLMFVLVLIALFAVTAGAAWYLLKNEDFLKSRLSAFVLEQTGRELAIDGILRVGLGRATSVEAENIRFANAEWADEPEMAQIGRLQLIVDVPSLFGKTPVIRLLAVESCSLNLVEREDGMANWDVLPASADPPEPPSGGGLPVVLLDAEIRNCTLTHEAPRREQPLHIVLNEWSQRLREDRHWQLQGTGKVGGESIAIDGWLAPAGALVTGGMIEHELNLAVGEISLQSSGTIQDVAAGQGANIKLHFHGPQITRVFNYLGLPPASGGPFDFGLSLDTKDQLTRLDVDGNLGELRIRAEGELDQLVGPSQGQVRGTLEGPDLARLGAALGIEGLAPAAFTLDADVGFERGLVRFRLFELRMPADKLSVLGVLSTAAGLAGTDLDIAFNSEELGQWAGAWDRPPRDIGAVMLTGRLLSDANGQSSIRARAEHPGSTLAVDGALGVLGKSLQPDLSVDFHSRDPRALASLLGDFSLPEAPMAISGRVAKPGDLLILDGVDLLLGGHTARLDGQVNPVAPFSGSEVDLEVRSPNAAELGLMFGRENLPVAPFTLTGRASRPGQRIRFEGVDLDLAGHRIHIDGLLNPEEQYARSKFEVQLDTPDVANLALLFGQEGLPHEPMKLSGVLKPEGNGLEFQTHQASLGDIRLDIHGEIPNVDQPLALNATFDIGLPSLSLLAFLAPEAKLPGLPFTAVGRLQSQEDRTHFESVRLTLGNLAAAIDGDLYHDQRLDLSIEAGGPDTTALAQWIGEPLVPEPFSLRTRVSGNFDAFELADINVQLGKSRANGDLRIGMGTPKSVSGKLTFPYLDLSQRVAGEKKEEPADSKPASAFVFDDTSVMWIGDYGITADLAIHAAELDLGNTTLRDIELGILLTPHRLALTPFSLTTVASGTLRGSAILDDSGAKPVLDVELAGQALRLGLAAVPGQEISSYPAVDLELTLHGTGFTRREMASSLDGRLRAYAGPGQVASAGIDLLFSDFLTELFDLLNPLAETNEYTILDCSVVAADISGGKVDVRPVVFHTEGITIFSSGSISLQNEKINLSFNTKPRKGLGITAGTVINTLIKVGGTLKQPTIELDPAGAIVGGTAAVATAGLSIVAKSFADRFLSSKDPCGDARKEIAKKDAL